MLKYVLILLAVPLASFAQSTDYGRVTLLRGWQLEDGSYQAGLEFTLNPGWKTYWRAPGPAGLPPVFSWEGSSNIGEVTFDWPIPKVIDQNGMITLGYVEHFVLPIRFTPAEKGPVRIVMSLNFGVCSDICVPAQAVFLTQLDGADREGAAQIEAALNHQPQSAEGAGLEDISCAVETRANGYEITAQLSFAEAIEAPLTVIEYSTQDIWIDMTESQSLGGAITANAPMQFYGGGALDMDMSEITVSVFGTERAVEIQGCPK